MSARSLLLCEDFSCSKIKIGLALAPRSRLTNMISFVTHRSATNLTNFNCSRFRQALKIAPEYLICLLFQRINSGLKLRNTSFRFLVVHPELDFVDFIVKVT